jgi:hypothetical protein
VQLVQQDGLTAVFFDPKALRVGWSPRVGNRVNALTLAQAQARWPDAIALLNGAMYSDCGTGCRIPDYALADPAGALPGRLAQGTAVGVDAEGRVRWGRWPAETPPRVGAQLYPELLRNGASVVDRSVNNERRWRAGVGQQGGQLVLVAGVGPMAQFTDKARALGITELGYTDGGGSTKLWVRGQGVVGDPEDRAVASWIIVTDEPSATTRKIAGGALLVGAAGLLAIALAGRR